MACSRKTENTRTFVRTSSKLFQALFQASNIPCLCSSCPIFFCVMARMKLFLIYLFWPTSLTNIVGLLKIYKWLEKLVIFAGNFSKITFKNQIYLWRFSSSNVENIFRPNNILISLFRSLFRELKPFPGRRSFSILFFFRATFRWKSLFKLFQSNFKLISHFWQNKYMFSLFRKDDSGW